jgi:hypothetical protein
MENYPMRYSRARNLALFTKIARLDDDINRRLGIGKSRGNEPAPLFMSPLEAQINAMVGLKGPMSGRIARMGDKAPAKLQDAFISDIVNRRSGDDQLDFTALLGNTKNDMSALSIDPTSLATYAEAMGVTPRNPKGGERLTQQLGLDLGDDKQESFLSLLGNVGKDRSILDIDRTMLANVDQSKGLYPRNPKGGELDTLKGLPGLFDAVNGGGILGGMGGKIGKGLGIAALLAAAGYGGKKYYDSKQQAKALAEQRAREEAEARAALAAAQLSAEQRRKLMRNIGIGAAATAGLGLGAYGLSRGSSHRHRD